MKKILSIVLALCMILALGATAAFAEDECMVAMITDYGDITDQSFNQTTYEACKAFADENGLTFQYYKPASDSDEDRITSIEKAIDDGYNVIVMPGYAFGPAIQEVAPEYDDITFIALDVSEGDIGDLAADVPANLYCAVYQEELCGYMAGYAAVKLGYTKLGFLGGMAVPAVVRYGYGFVQGVDAAAAELELSDVEVKYVYGTSSSATPTSPLTWIPGMLPALRSSLPAAAVSSPPPVRRPRRSAARSSALTSTRPAPSTVCTARA